MSVVRFEPVQNAIDFLVYSAELLAGTPSARDLKYATVNLVSAIEILLKARLVEEHWTLVVRDLRRKNKKTAHDRFMDGDFTSIAPDEAFERLRDVAGIDLPDEIPGYRALQDRRNQIVHFGVEVSEQEILSNAARVLDFALTFLGEQFSDSEHADVVADGLGDLRPLLSSVQTLVDERMKRVVGDILIECAHCGQMAFEPGVDVSKCHFCLDDTEPEEAALDYVDKVLGVSQYEAFKNGGAFPLYVCPDCSFETLVAGVELQSSDNAQDRHDSRALYWLCFNDAEPIPLHDIDECRRCGVLTRTSDDDGLAICSNC